MVTQKWWDRDQLDVVDRAIDSARGGRPALLSVVGEPGQGKSALVGEVTRRATKFQVLAAEGHELGARMPLTMLRELGVPAAAAPGSASGAVVDSFQAAQGLRVVVDRLQRTGPVLVAVDDLQWVDPESVESLVWLLRRSFGDRLLVVAASRPLRAPALPVWRRFAAEYDGLVEVALNGLSLRDASEVVRVGAPSASPALTARLWKHTGGNPLYLNALLSEHDVADLQQMETLPAPADLARSLAARLKIMSPDAGALLLAVAVLGPSWVQLPLAAQLAEVTDPSGAAQVLLDAGLMVGRFTGARSEVRIYHSMIRAGVYQDIPIEKRRRLHLRAAGLRTSPVTVLEHRFAATDRFDDGLAVDLLDFANNLHGRGQYREAARFLRWSSAATADPGVRESRWLDSLFDQLLARDVDEVESQVSAVDQASDEPRRAVVQGMLLIIRTRWIEAVHVLQSVDDRAVAAADSRTRYRLETLLAWVRLTTGVPPADIQPRLARAERELDIDTGIQGMFMFAAGAIYLQQQTEQEAWGSIGATLAPRPQLAPATSQEVYSISWTGILAATVGRYERAVDDLEVFDEQIRLGVVDESDGGSRAFLGSALWMRGDWPRARIVAELANEFPHGIGRVYAQATKPLMSLAAGDAEAARADLDGAWTVLKAAPWPEAVHQACIAEILLLHMAGSIHQRQDFLARLERTLGSRLYIHITQPPAPRPPWWLHVALAHIWAGDLHRAVDRAQALERVPTEPRWAHPAAQWIRGLVAEARGDLTVASEHLATAASDPDTLLTALPLHHAHAYADLARVERALGHTRPATAAAAAATARYRQLGAAGYLPNRAGPGSPGGVLSMLTDRERDVVSLLTQGLSYAQIARELYVTSSTVSFHLTHAYAKTNTTSRHGLVELVRVSN